MNEEQLYEKILKILILSNYAEKIGTRFSEMPSEQDAFYYFMGRWTETSIPYFDVEQNRFHVRMKRDALLILEVVKEEVRQA